MLFKEFISLWLVITEDTDLLWPLAEDDSQFLDTWAFFPKRVTLLSQVGEPLHQVCYQGRVLCNIMQLQNCPPIISAILVVRSHRFQHIQRWA